MATRKDIKPISNSKFALVCILYFGAVWGVAEINNQWVRHKAIQAVESASR